MSFLARGAVVLLTCWLLIGQVVTGDVPVAILDFIATVSGNYDNTATVNQGNEAHDLIQLKFVPVEVPALSGQPVLYMEEAVKGGIYRRQLMSLSIGSDGVIYATQYNLTDSSQYKPGQFNVADLDTVSPDSIQIVNDCLYEQVLVISGVYSAAWSDCRHRINGEHPIYTGTITCGGVSFDIPASADETSTRAPYTAQLVGEKYPVKGAPADYVSPCDKKQ